MFTFESNEIVMIPIDKIDLPETPLRLFEPRSREEIENLAESIRQSGLIHPIIVARKAEGGRFVILGGETRFRASNLAGKTEVPCRIVQIKDDPGEASLIALMDNLARKNMHPLDIADALRRQLDHVDRFEQIYRPLGWTKGRFSQILGLSKLPNEIRDLLKDHTSVSDDSWTPGERHLREINRLSEIPDYLENQIAITRQMLENHWNVSKVEAAVKQVKDAKTKGNKRRKSSHVEIPGLPEGAIAKVYRGKLRLEVNIDDTGSWLDKWSGIASVLGDRQFDPRALLQPENKRKTVPRPVRKRIPCPHQTEKSPIVIPYSYQKDANPSRQNRER